MVSLTDFNKNLNYSNYLTMYIYVYKILYINMTLLCFREKEKMYDQI